MKCTCLIAFLLTLDGLGVPFINAGLEGLAAGTIPYRISEVCVPIMLNQFAEYLLTDGFSIYMYIYIYI